ncbi:hypothetical protein C7999DRAFT_29700 [Corynascus novoguineensis]|uniref:Uncharacterized protein n=1 Tax=Corynascus novoguineensis TaxID=1126955 RepID=A0AAN7HRZ4_9PEZI|nr:hypothetical protein C7999DRAFT_29700 [Corynascus novoguineensis]
MPGLAASRHAPSSHGPSTRTNDNANLAVTPAPIDGVRGDGSRGDTTHNPHSSPTPTTTSTTHPSPIIPTRDDHLRRDRRRRAAAAAASAPHELARYAKIVRRLQWKLPFLAQGYRQAVDHRVGTDPAAVAEAELMFKLDFFEYYMLIERALVHLLGVFGVAVSRGGEEGGSSSSGAEGPSRRAAENPTSSISVGDLGNPGGRDNEKIDILGGGDGNNKNYNERGLGASVWRDRQRHRYHANVLAALDRTDNPLHWALGTGEVRKQLGRAKDLRNRWKTAGEDEDENDAHCRLDDTEQQQQQAGQGIRCGASRAEESGAGPEKRSTKWRPRTKKVAAPLDTYRLEHMLEVIFQGFDEAFRIAEDHVRGRLDWAEDEEDGRAMDWTAIGDEEEQWEFMVDAMDWEAV